MATVVVETFIETTPERVWDAARAHLAGRADRAPGQQQVLGQGGLAGVGVGDDGEGAPARSLRGGSGF